MAGSPGMFRKHTTVTKIAIVLMLTLLALVQLAFAFQLAVPEDMLVGRDYGNQILVPTNQILTLAGERIQFAGWPSDMVLSPSGGELAVLLAEGIQLLSPGGTLLRHIPLHRTSFGGIQFTPDGQSIIAGQLDKTDSVVAADSVTGRITTLATFPGGSLPSGVAVAPWGNRIYVALNGRNLVAAIDTATRRVVRIAPTGVAPFGVALTPDGTRLFVSNWGGRRPFFYERRAYSAGTPVLVDKRGIAASGTVSVFDAVNLRRIAEIPVGLHPSSLHLSPDGRVLAIANSNSDSVTLIDTVTLDVLETIPIPAFPEGYAGSSPTAVAFSPSGRWLYVACGGNNAIAVLQRVSARPDSSGRMFTLAGYVPVDWYPVALAVSTEDDDTETVFAVNAKGIGSRGGSNTFNVKGMTLGTVVSFTGGVKSLSTATVRSNNDPFAGRARRAEVTDLKSLGIDHVFYIIKENKTYDQILGDLGQGDGDPFLTQYGWNVTPNHHRLARDFVTLDNFYTSGVVSADGHQWVTQSFVTDYIERAFGRWPRSYPFAGNDPLAFASTGFLWDHAQRAGLGVRVFGEFSVIDHGGRRPWRDYYADAIMTGPSRTVITNSSIASMRSITEPRYPGWALNIPDVYRAKVFQERLRGFERQRNLPNLVIIFLPSDHTAGLLPGYPKPASMVADNDLALGQMVEAITHSSYWPRSAIFVTEDDSQDGVDHVDGHRTVGLVISPFIKGGRVDSTHYNQISMIRTIEELLGMPPMNKFDAAALPMRSIFTTDPNFQPFRASINQVPLDDLTSSTERLDKMEQLAALQSQAMDFTHPDAAPEDQLNRIQWHLAKGWSTPYPRIVHKWGCKTDDDDAPAARAITSLARK
jgi:YVTN family beta-propeller protein